MAKKKRTYASEMAEKEKLQKKADGGDAEAAGFLAFKQPMYQNAESELEMENYFLRWSEQQYLAMASEYPTTVEDRDESKVSHHYKKQRKTRSVLGEPRISKQRRNMQRQKHQKPDTPPMLAPPAVDFNPPSTSSISRKQDSPRTKPRRKKTQTSRRELAPQKVSKEQRFDGFRSKTVTASQRRKISQKRSSDSQSLRQPQSVPGEITTRSGRVSRPPIKWVPG